ncbi:hypothetical protein L6270_01725 [Candidatus Parcubacteria bacterium]|nr:hypothetical protein [Patescibacteria group bacterium]MBU4309859.1 hypothetical protein [Patescibacteria group bacterium]MBU4431730.1 hypothetical protein [Patescibacteria group bacterium]MBU4578198.1 hypothetical protein [Patescibacteria group bacterium]MCG2696734.1 hypothetical protein [Candidatus Parcubacteria bacterium]
MLWINFLHLYQPANKDAYFIQEATDMSYRRIVRALEENPQTKFTLNIQGCLFAHWEALNEGDLIGRIKKLVKKGQVELTGTCAYHPLVPLIPLEEVERQIKENEIILQKHFGSDFKPRGFFFPEMAYGVEAAKLVKSLGYEWIIVDEIAHGGQFGNVDFSKNYLDENSGLKVVFRMRGLSQNFVPDILGNDQKLLDYKNKHELYITATDAELYGLRHLDHTAEFEKLLKRADLKTLTISEHLQNKTAVKVKITPCNWESTESEITKSVPYALWLDPRNKIHKQLWNLANLANEVIENNAEDENIIWAQRHYTLGLASCTFWWASGRDFKLFGSVSWNPDEVERGVNEFIRAIRSLHNVETRSVKIKGEKLYIKIKHMIWHEHWEYHWKKN